MNQESPTARRDVEITNPLGLHLRPADKFVQLAGTFAGTEIRVLYKDREFNGKSILELTSLGAECGTRLVLVAQGPQAEAAVAALADLVMSQFHESTDSAHSSDACV